MDADHPANGVPIPCLFTNKEGVLGRPLQIVAEDDQTSNPGSVLAFSRLARRPEIVAFIGSVRSTQVNAMAPDVLRTGKPMMFGGTDPTLTQAPLQRSVVGEVVRRFGCPPMPQEPRGPRTAG